MFSRRLTWPPQINSLSRRREARGGGGVAILAMPDPTPPGAGLPSPADAIAAALADPSIAAYDPAPRGLEETRRAVAEDCASRGRPTSPDRLILTASTS